MIQSIQKLRNLLTPGEQRRALIVFAMMVVSAFLEVVGVASVMPFVAVLSKPDIVGSNVYLTAIYKGLGFADTQSFMVFLGTFLLGAFLTSLAFRALTLYAIQRFSTMRLHSIASRLLKIYLAQPYEFFVSRNSSSLSKAMLSEVATVTTGLLLPTMRALSGILIVAAIVTLLVVVRPTISVVLVGGLGFGYLAIYAMTRRRFRRAGEARLHANDARFRIAIEALQGIRELRVLGRENEYGDRFAVPSKDFARQQAAVLMVRELPYFAAQGIAFGGVLLLLLVLVARGDQLGTTLPLVTFYAFAGYRLLPALQDMYRSASQIRFSAPALDELSELFSLRSQMLPAASKVLVPLRFERTIRFDHVTFAYRSAKGAAVHDVDLEIAAGTSVAFVGQTGSGKSTVVGLLLGLFVPQSGAILIDGVRLDAGNMRAWQANLGYVPQEIFIADDTVAANIAFGVSPDEVTMAAVERAAKQAHIHDFIVSELPQGYQTRIGERGAKLSGGQRQRVGIARALYGDPAVVVFDEATSALDNQTEAAVMEAIESIRGTRTVIMIAHRLSTVQSCHTLYFLEHGYVRERGSFTELMARGERFPAFAKAGRREDSSPSEAIRM